jgi:hypothetical protein
MTNKKIIVKEFMASYEPDVFLTNEHGTYMYYSKNGASGINLESFFEDLVEHVLDGNYVESELKAEVESLQSQLAKAEADKVEILEKHKKDVIDAYYYGANGNDFPDHPALSSGEQYYNQLINKHGNNK